VLLLLAANGGCGPGNCSFQYLERISAERTVECCGASVWAPVPVDRDEAEADLAFAKAVGPPPPVHAWLTTADCTQLFEGEYPPAIGSPSPRCPVFLGPVTPGEVSPRRKLPRGNYRIFVQAFSSSPGPLKVIVDVGVWGEKCGGPQP
jgi:hypothetical protein